MAHIGSIAEWPGSSAQAGWCAEAEEDCNRALHLEAPVLNPKTLLRRATARVALQKIRAARADYKQVMSVLRRVLQSKASTARVLPQLHAAAC